MRSMQWQLGMLGTVSAFGLQTQGNRENPFVEVAGRRTFRIVTSGMMMIKQEIGQKLFTPHLCQLEPRACLKSQFWYNVYPDIFVYSTARPSACRQWYGCHTLQSIYLTPWSRVLLEKLTVLQLIKKYPSSHAARRFINVSARARHFHCPEPDQSNSFPPFVYMSGSSYCSHLHICLQIGLFLPSSRPSSNTTKIIRRFRN